MIQVLLMLFTHYKFTHIRAHTHTHTRSNKYKRYTYCRSIYLVQMHFDTQLLKLHWDCWAHQALLGGQQRGFHNIAATKNDTCLGLFGPVFLKGMDGVLLKELFLGRPLDQKLIPTIISAHAQSMTDPKCGQGHRLNQPRKKTTNTRNTLITKDYHLFLLSYI